MEKKIRLDKEIIFDNVADLFNVFGNVTRLKILLALSDNKELSVTSISDILNMSQSAISHQLKNLKNAKLIGNRRDGKIINYFLLDNHVSTILNQGFEHIMEDEDEENI